MDNRKKNEKKRNGLPTQMNLIIHIVMGIYLWYLSYSIFNSSGETRGAIMIIFPVLFGIIGAVLIFSSLRSLQRGEYEGGAADPEKESEKVMEEQINENMEDEES